MIIETTNRKFYNKWFYKVSLYIHGARFLHNLTDFPIEYNDVIYRSTFFKSKVDVDTITKLLQFIEQYDKSEWQRRSEMNTLDIYTNNKDLFDNIAKKFKKNVSNLVCVDEEIVNIESKFTPVIVKKLPHNKYKFKVFLKPHTFNKDREEKNAFLSFIDSQVPRIRITPAVKHWFLDTNWNWDPRYIHVEDEGTLMLLKMRNPQALGRIHEHIIPDK